MSKKSEKSPAKSKQLANADLNFISKQPFEQVIEQLQDLGNRHVKPNIRQVDHDTAIFQLSFVRGDKTTAEVTGRLKRWAGDMTHIYCDGRIFKKSNVRSQLWSWAIDLPGLIGLWLFSLLLISSKNLSVSLTDLLLYTFTLSLIIFGLFHFARIILKIVIQSITLETSQFRDQFISNPEAKDRERLFHAITSIIRDDDIYEQQLRDESSEMKALSEEEEAALIEQITLAVNQNQK
jgi:hypothetical protein